MKQLILIFVVILASASISHFLLQDPGYVLIQIHSWRIESSVIVMALTLAILLLSLFLATHLISCLLRFPFVFRKHIKKWQKRRDEHRFKQGLDAFFKGEWGLALQKLKHQPKGSAWPLDLISAQAAQNQGLIKERDQFLKMAVLEAPKERETILMFQAQLQITNNQFEQAQATLNHIRHHSKSPSAQWYILQAKVALHFENYQQVLDILSNELMLQKDKDSYHDLFKQSLQGLAGKKQLADAKTLIQLLKKQSDHVQNDLDILIILAPSLKAEPYAKKWLLKKMEAGLKQTPINTHFLPLVAEWEFDTRKFQQYEAMLLKATPSHAIYLTLAKMKTKQHLWGAALNDLNHAIKLYPSKEAYTLMAEIYLSLKQNSNALNAMQQALNLS